MAPRALILAGIAAAAACGDSGGPAGAPRLLVTPVLDSMFVGDTLPPGALRVTYLDAAGDTQPTGPVRWSSSRPTVAAVDSLTGEVVGAGPGEAIVSAQANGVTGAALVIVSRTLEVALLLDTIYLMPGDTLTLPVAVRRRGGAPPDPWFGPSPNEAVYSVDSASGLVTARSPGAARFVVYADTVADTGAVDVRLPADTTGGRGYFTALGTVIRRAGAEARAVNYRRRGDTLTFRINLGIPTTGNAVENVVVTLRDAVTAPGIFAVDSLSAAEAFGAGVDPICHPPRSWGLWSTRTTNPTVTALSRPGGTIAITRVIAVTGGMAISGRFAFSAQRVDFPGDPLGVLPLRGTFVAPLVGDPRPC
jgi:hypothetical protein